jgi:hypothetical protein
MYLFGTEEWIARMLHELEAAGVGRSQLASPHRRVVALAAEATRCRRHLHVVAILAVPPSPPQLSALPCSTRLPRMHNGVRTMSVDGVEVSDSRHRNAEFREFCVDNGVVCCATPRALWRASVSHVGSVLATGAVY